MTGPTPHAHRTTRRIQRLARSFPQLQGAVGIDPWNPGALEKWAHHQRRGLAARWAADFLLALCGYYPHVRADVWAEAMARPTGNLADDPAKRKPYQDWLADPWWPKHHPSRREKP